MSVGVKQVKQGLFLKTTNLFESSKTSSDSLDNNFKDWSVYILKRKVITEPKPIKL